MMDRFCEPDSLLMTVVNTLYDVSHGYLSCALFVQAVDLEFGCVSSSSLLVGNARDPATTRLLTGVHPSQKRSRLIFIAVETSDQYTSIYI